MPVFTCPKGHIVIVTKAYYRAPATFYCPTCKRNYPAEASPIAKETRDV
jgi:transposase-like protein